MITLIDFWYTMKKQWGFYTLIGIMIIISGCQSIGRNRLREFMRYYQSEGEDLIPGVLYGRISGPVKHRKRTEFSSEYIIIEPQIKKQIFPRVITKDGQICDDTLKPSTVWEGTYEILEDTLKITWKTMQTGKEKKEQLEHDFVENYLINKNGLHRLSDRKNLVCVYNDAKNLLRRDLNRLEEVNNMVIKATLFMCPECNMALYTKDEDASFAEYTKNWNIESRHWPQIPARIIVDGFSIAMESSLKVLCDEKCEKEVSTVPMAIFYRLPQKLSQILMDGADPDYVIPEKVDYIGGLNGLFFAAYTGEIAFADTLIVHGANVNITTRLGSTPLMIAAREGHAAMVEFLLNHGADPVVRRVDGTSAIDWAMESGHQQVVTLLEKKGAKVSLNFQDKAALQSLMHYTKHKLLKNIKKIKASYVNTQIGTIKDYLYEGDIRNMKESSDAVLKRYPEGFHVPYFTFWSAIGDFLTGKRKDAVHKFKLILENPAMSRFHSFAYFAVLDSVKNPDQKPDWDTIRIPDSRFVMYIPEDFEVVESDKLSKIIINHLLTMRITMKRSPESLGATMSDVIDTIMKVSVDSTEIDGFKAVRFETYKIDGSGRLRIGGIAINTDSCTYIVSAEMPESPGNDKVVALAKRIINTITAVPDSSAGRYD